jgi:hypothetical protein
MASINDFKLVNTKSIKYFNILEKELIFNSDKFSDTEKARFGFYLYMLENICGIKDMSDLLRSITDTDFHVRILNNSKFEDQGIDAVYIDDDNLSINLFNFKFREKFKPDSKQSINETIITTKFINAIVTENIDKLDGIIYESAKNILSKLQSNDIWKMNLYVVSNETFEIKKTDTNLKDMEKVYDLEIIPFGLPKIKELMSIRPEPIDAELVLASSAIMSYSENSISSDKSYIIRLSNSEVIRITSDDKNLRNQYNIEHINELSDTNLDFNVLFDNVRGFVQKSQYNKNIEKSLKEEPSKFFMYNNGLTIIAKSIKAEPINADKRFKLIIKDLQILNGGQTLRTIHNFNKLDKDNITNFLSKSEILVRILTTGDEYTNKIAEYTNSQNSISSVDLKSLSNEQIELEQYLDEHNIIYARKSGDTGLSDKDYEYKISIEKFGQILYSIKGFPEKATNQKKQIFGKNYEAIFGSDVLNISDAPQQIKDYFNIKNKYENNENYESNDQKLFYILYMMTILRDKNIDELIEILEKIILEFPTEKDIAPARKLIQSKFKIFLDKELKKYNI